MPQQLHASMPSNRNEGKSNMPKNLRHTVYTKEDILPLNNKMHQKVLKLKKCSIVGVSI